MYSHIEQVQSLSLEQFLFLLALATMSAGMYATTVMWLRETRDHNRRDPADEWAMMLATCNIMLVLGIALFMVMG